MTGVQLIGKDRVLSTFEGLNADAWALYQGKQFIVGGIGYESLDSWLTNFAAAGSTATYLLRVYDSDQQPTSSTGNTDYIACISFKVCDPYEGQGIHGHNNALMKRIGALEDQLKDRGDDKDNELDIVDIVKGWLSDPVKLNHVAGAIRQIFGSGQPNGLPTPIIPVQVPQAIGAVEPAATDAELDRVTLLAGALDRLEKKDSKIVEHLCKLADLSEKNPAMFSMIIQNFDAL